MDLDTLSLISAAFTGLKLLYRVLYVQFSKEPRRPAVNAQDEELEQLRREKELLLEQLQQSNEELKEKARVQEQLELANKALEEKIRLQELRQRRRAEVRIDTDKFNFGITGRAGAGKSSLINALRNIKYGAEGTAAVSEIECTDKMAAFPHPELPNLVFWDMPGAGTLSSPAGTYYEDNVIHALDAVIIVINGKLQLIDVEIARQAKQNQKHVAFVLSKADMHIKNRILRTPTNMKKSAESFRREVMQALDSELAAANPRDVEKFIVSGYAFSNPESPYINYTRKGKDASLEEMDESLLLKFICAIGKERLD